MGFGWILRVPSLIYFEWIYESVTSNITKPENYFVEMMQSMFIVPITDKNVFPSISFILQFFLSIIAYVAFISVAIFNLNVVKKLYFYLIGIILFVMGCNQYRLILLRLNDADNFSNSNIEIISSKWVLSNFDNQSYVGRWSIYWVDFIQFIPTSQFKSASIVLILPLIYCPWLIFVQYFDLMSNQVLALSYGIANLPGLCLALNLPVEAQIFTYNFAVTSFLIGIIYKIVSVCVVLPKAVSDFLADLFVVINFNHHAAGWIEIPSVLWSLFDLSKQFFIFWIGLLITHMLTIESHFENRPTFLVFAAISESVQTPLGLIGFSVASCYVSRMILNLVDWMISANQFNDRNNSHGLAEGFSTLLMMLSLNRSMLKVNEDKFQTSIKAIENMEKASSSPIGLIVLVLLIISSSILESAREMLSSKLVHLTATALSRQMWQKHITCLVLSTVVFWLPVLICFKIYSFFSFDFWLITIMGSFLMTSIHMLNSFVTYCLYLDNAHKLKTNKSILHINYDTDEIISWLNFIIQAVELCIAIGLVFLLIARALSGHWNWVSLGLLIVHFYFNIYERIRTNWVSFHRRKLVTKIIDKMYTVCDIEEISQLEDICAICYNDLSTMDHCGPVKRTICRHFFHKECLKKWLLIKHSCPMCSKDFNDSGNTAHEFPVDYVTINSESDTESISNDSGGQNQDLVSSTSSESSIYDDKDIDLNVYQEINEWDARTCSSSVTRSESVSSGTDEHLSDSDNIVTQEVTKRSVSTPNS